MTHTGRAQSDNKINFNDHFASKILASIVPLFFFMIRMKNWQDSLLNLATEGVERCSVYACMCVV